MGITIDVTFDDQEFLDALDRAPDVVAQKGWRIVRKRSLAVERIIKDGPPDGMPVDTGRARASWGHWEPGLMRRDVQGNANAEAKESDAVFKENEQGLSITQGTNVWYVPDLNAGSSQQTPAGFVDRAAEGQAAEMERELGELIEEL